MSYFWFIQYLIRVTIRDAAADGVRAGAAAAQAGPEIGQIRLATV